METYDLEPLRGEMPALTEAEEARQIEIEESISAIENEAGDEDLSEDDETRLLPPRIRATSHWTGTRRMMMPMSMPRAVSVSDWRTNSR